MELPENPGTEQNTSTPTDEGQRSQLDEMLMDSVKSPEKKTETPVVEEEEVETVVEESPPRPKFEAPEEDEEEEEEPEVQELEEEEHEEEEVDELQQLREELANLKAIISQKDQEDDAAEEEDDFPEISVDSSQFLTEEEADQLYQNPAEVLRKFGERIYAKAREDTIKDIPNLTLKSIQRQSAIERQRAEFWEKNKDLKQKVAENPRLMEFVKLTVNQVQADNPGLGTMEIFNKAASVVRKDLGLAAQAQEREKKVSRQSNQPKRKPKGKRKPQEADDRSGLQQELDAMLAVGPRR